MATKQKEVIKMDDEQKGSGMAIVACVIVAILAAGGLGAYCLTGEELSTPTLLSPSDDSETTDNTPTFEWKNVPNAENYRLLVDNDPDFSSPEVDVTLGVIDNIYTVPDENVLPYGSYYWKVIAIRGSVESESDTWTFDLVRLQEEEDLASTAAEMRDKFISWLAANHPEFGITSETEWTGTIVYPGMEGVSYYLFFSEDWEMGVSWHVTIPPHDWARIYLMHRITETSPSHAFEISSLDAQEEPHVIDPPESVWR